MAVFKYTARDSAGVETSGRTEAPNAGDVEDYLRRRDLEPVSVRRDWGKVEISFGKKVKTRDLVAYTRMFATMTKASMPLDQTLRQLADQSPCKHLSQATQEMLADIQSGFSLGEAMRRHRKIFSPLYVAMIEAGERTGRLDTLLIRLADLLKRNETVRSKVKSAMTYPAILGVITIGVVAILLAFVVPQFAEMFMDNGVPLPTPTKIAIGTSEFLRTFWWAPFSLVIALIVGYRQAVKAPPVAYAKDALLMRLPVLGKLLVKGALARVSRTLATLQASGMTIIDGIEQTSDIAGNRVIARSLREAAGSVATGTDVWRALEEQKVFPGMMTSMVSIGEEAGNIDEMLAFVAEFYDEDVAESIEGALKLIEPIMLVVMAALAGGVMISIYLPMFDMITAMGGV